MNKFNAKMLLFLATIIGLSSCNEIDNKESENNSISQTTNNESSNKSEQQTSSDDKKETSDFSSSIISSEESSEHIHTLVGGLCSECGYLEVTGLENFEYSEYASGIYIDKLINTDLKNIVLPEIYGISNKAFEGALLDSLTIPTSVKSYERNAFLKCGVKNIYYLGTIEEWAGNAFPNEEATPVNRGSNFYVRNGNEFETFTDLTLKEGLVVIKPYAFFNFSFLKTVTLPTSLKSIGEKAFAETDIASMNDNDVEYYTFNNNSHYLAVCLGNDVQTVKLHEDTKIIGGEFNPYSPKYLRSVEVPKGLISVSDYAFYGCFQLVDFYITISGPLTYIGQSAFQGCGNLKTISFPQSLTTIGDKAFKECESLNLISVYDTIENVGADAFIDCKNLDTIIYCSKKEDFINNVALIAALKQLGRDSISIRFTDKTEETIGNY